MKKHRLSVYLDADIMHALADYAARRDQSRSLIAEAAIASFLSPDAAEHQESATAKRLDQIDRRLKRVERDQTIAVETLAVFIRHWLTVTPQLPEPAQAAAREDGREVQCLRGSIGQKVGERAGARAGGRGGRRGDER